MRGLAAALLVLLCTMALCSCAQDNVSAATCCFSFTSRQIPRKSVVAYHKTSDKCPTPGIIFVTKRGLQICANPSNAWVRDYIRDLEQNS